MENLFSLELHHDDFTKVQTTKEFGISFQGIDILIIVAIISILLGWILHKIISARYIGVVHYKDKSGVELTAKVSPAEQDV